jgi:hypothetical protein
MDKESTGGMTIPQGTTSSWTRRIHCRNGNSARKHQLKDKESTAGMVIPPGITSSWRMNPQEEWQFRQDSPAHGKGIHRRNGNSARNHQLMEKEFTGGMAIPPGITSS